MPSVGYPAGAFSGAASARHGRGAVMAPPVRNIDDWRRLSDAEREERTNALSALRLGRRKGMALGLAAAEVETSMAAIYRWVPDAVRRGVLGIPYATPRDRIWRLRPIYANGRLDFVELEGSDEADEAERVFDLQWAWIHGDRDAGSELQRYRGGRVGGQLVEADLAALRAIAAQGDDPPEVYRGLLG